MIDFSTDSTVGRGRCRTPRQGSLKGCATDVDFFRFDLSGASAFEVFIGVAGVGYRGMPAGVAWIYVEPTILDANGSEIASDHERRRGARRSFTSAA